MALALTFTDHKLLDSRLVAPDGAVHYTLGTTSGFRGRKVTTITATPSGLGGIINWREHHFVINGVQRNWDDLKEKSGGLWSSQREWNWGNGRPYNLEYHDSHKELLATPTFGPGAGTVRFTPYRGHLLHENEPAVIYFPYTMMQDEFERMFLLMAILQTDIHRQDQQQSYHTTAITAATVIN